jgi:hypothetical protein
MVAWFSVEVIIVVQTLLIVVLQFSPSFTSEFGARKMCHAGSGALMLALDPQQWEARWFVYSVVATSLLMTWVPALPAFRFARTKQDVGISIYLVLVWFWFYQQLDLAIVAPMFFAVAPEPPPDLCLGLTPHPTPNSGSCGGDSGQVHEQKVSRAQPTVDRGENGVGKRRCVCSHLLHDSLQGERVDHTHP